MAILGAIVSGLTSLAGGAATAGYNAAEAAKNRDFQERMTKHRYQYQVADLRAAGLNPALSYMNAPSAAPGGSTASVGDITGGAVTSGLAAKRQSTELAVMRSAMEKNRADTDNALGQEANARAMAASNSALEAQRNLQNEQLELAMPMLKADAEFFSSDTGNKLRKAQKTGEAVAPYSSWMPNFSIFKKMR